MNGVEVLGAPLRVGVLHQRQVSQSRAPLSSGVLAGAPPQQTHSNVGCVVVLKGDVLDLEHTHSVKKQHAGKNHTHESPRLQRVELVTVRQRSQINLVMISLNVSDDRSRPETS